MKYPKRDRFLTIFSCAASLLLTTLGFPLHADDFSAPHRKPDVKVWKANQAKGEQALANSNLPEAEQCFKAALGEAENFGSKDERLADTLRELGEVYYAEGKKADAEALLRRAAETMRDYPQAQVEIRPLLEYARLCLELHHYDEAIKSLERVQSLVMQHLGRSHPIAVESSMLLAEAYVRKGDYAGAEPLLKRSFELFRNPVTKTVMTRPSGGAIYGHDVYRIHYRPNYAYALQAASQLYFVYVKEHKPVEAAAILKQAFELIESNASSADPVYAQTLDEFGLSFVQNDNLDPARNVFAKLILVIDKAKGKMKAEAFDSALRLQSRLAGALVKEAKLAEAEILYTSLATAAENNFGPDSRECDTAQAGLAQFYLDHDQFEKAEHLYRWQLAHAEKFQPDSPAAAPTLTGLETIYTHLGRDAELEEVYEKQIRLYEKMFGQNSVALVKPLNARAALLRKLKRETEAAPLEARAAAINAAQAK